MDQHAPERPPLRPPELPAGGLWTEARLVAETGSTNADLVEAARAGAGEGLVLVAEHQHAGRGRSGRTWSAPPRAGLAVSMLLRPGQAAPVGPAVGITRWGWLPLLAGVALVETVGTAARLPAGLKWPNDLLLSGPGGAGKCAGILAEVAGGAVVLGIGLNVTQRAGELPAGATSLALAGAGAAGTDRDGLLAGLLAALAGWYGRWRRAGGDAGSCGLREAYRERSVTIGRRVQVQLPDGSELTGTVDAVDSAGRLLLQAGTGTRALAAGDVTHLRPA